jgi:hypothetical protein
MASADNAAAEYRDLADAELAQLYRATGIDLSGLPAIMTPEELAPALRRSVGALAQDRFRNRGIPYIRMNRTIRYSRAEVARYLAAHRAEVVSK